MSSRQRFVATFAALVFACSLAGCTQALQGSAPTGAPVAFASSPSGGGYWVAYANGTVRGYGDARPYGGTSRLALRKPIVGIAASRSGHGYWLRAADGGVFSFGDAGFRGSLGKKHVRTAIVAMARSKSGHGY